MDSSLHEIAKALATPGKGILAADESVRTAGVRLESVGVENTDEARRQYRDVFLTAAGIEQYLSGVILFDETFRQNAATGETFVGLLQKKGVLPGIKVDGSTVPFPNFPNEEFTQGLDGLPARLEEYAKGGTAFTKWRTVIRIGDGIPSEATLAANAHGLAHYAAVVQAAGMVPIIEPEVLHEGSHTIEQAEEVTTRTLQRVFEEVQNYHVDLAGLVLKSSMVLSGDKAVGQSTPQEVAEATIRTFQNSVPKEVPSIVFLSGGQTPEQSIKNLQAIAGMGPHPWQISFSYARSLQGPALEVWRGKQENIPAAQAEFIKYLEMVSAAAQGKYSG